jgi:hypothetical protein
MTKQEMSLHNESLAIQKIRTAHAKGNLYDAMKLCQDFMCLDAKEAYAKVKLLCEDMNNADGK